MLFRKKFSLTILDVLLIVIGITLILLTGYLNFSPVNTLLEAIGTSLIAAGLVAYLTRRFYTDDRRDVIELLAPNRMVLDDEYKRDKYTANDIDILGIALSGCLKELANDRTEKMLKQILFARAHVRLLFLNPFDGYVHQRALEDSIPVDELQNILKQSVIYCVKIFGRLDKLYKNTLRKNLLERDKIGSFQIRITDLCPHLTIYHTDDTILWGLYTFASRGLDSPALRVPKTQSAVFGQLITHFDKLWDRSSENYLIRYYDPYITQFSQPDTIIPDLNNPQSLNRYAYALNNPIRFNDPSGHCPLCAPIMSTAGGVIIGSIAGVSIYVATTYISHRQFSVDDYNSALANGIVAGALVGSGVGIVKPAISKPLIGAGVGMISSQMGYSTASGNKYNNDEMVISSTIGGLSGAITSGMSAGTTGGLLSRAATEGLAGSSQYILTERMNNRTPDFRVAIRTGIYSSINSLVWDSGEYIGLKNPARSEFFEDMVESRSLSKTLRPTYVAMLRKSRILGGFKDIFRSSIAYLTGSAGE